MFINNTDSIIFDEFEHKYANCIYAQYPHISNVNIHCVYPEQYLRLKNVPNIDDIESDPFAYSCSNTGNNCIAYIIYSPIICSSLGLNNDELDAAIAHEVGHIVHYFNTSLENCPNIVCEIKADEVATYLGLKSSLINVLSKLVHSNNYTENQINGMKKRMLFLRI